VIQPVEAGQIVSKRLTACHCIRFRLLAGTEDSSVGAFGAILTTRCIDFSASQKRRGCSGVRITRKLGSTRR